MHSFAWDIAGKPDAKTQAAKAAKAVKKGTFKRTRKPRYSVVFHRPSTLKRTRDPKYTRIR
jgi:large subunit ribosomal protein L23Ae